MSWNPRGTRLSYNEYMMAHEFVEDLKSSNRDVGERLTMEISRQTSEVIASNEALTQENIRATEVAAGQITDAMNSGFGELSGVMSDGFSHISYEIQQVSAGVERLDATFHWGFGQMLASMGRMNDALTELIKIAKTPVQTAAFNHYEIARDAFRQGLYRECLDSLDKAINGDHTSTGYKLEWRFHQMKGILRLGFVNCDQSLINLAAAEESFLLAARYAKADYPAHAAQAFLSAGWSAYCQGKMMEGLAYTEQALSINPNLGEALFQAAKVSMALGKVDSALPLLSKAINIDRFYTLKAAGDGDFQRYDGKLRDFLDAMRREKYRQEAQKVREALEKFRFWIENAPEAKNDAAIRKANEFLAEGEKWPLLDMLNVIQTLPEHLAGIERAAKAAVSYISFEDGSVISVYYAGICPVKETYQERVIIKPAGFFSSEVTELQTRTRTVMKPVSMMKPLQGKRLDLYDGMGNKKLSFEFSMIPAGEFMMGDSRKHKVVIHRDFYLGKYPVTQAQWEALMGNNPSYFKGADLPVETVSWEDCQEFIKRLNATGKASFRLPTEAEWEYACRAGSTGAYCFGDNIAQLGEYAWYKDNSGGQTQPVGRKKPNEWGLHDMHGNVWEWCQDWYDYSYPDEAVTDPQGPLTGSDRVDRGGGWNFDASRASSAYRYGDPAGDRGSYLGFRLVCLPVR